MFTLVELTFTTICFSILALTNAAAAARTRRRMSEATFTIGYTGPAVEGGRMKVQYLAHAMLATEALFTETNLLLNGNATIINVDFTANQEGSIEIVLQLIQETASGAVDIFASDPVTALANATMLAKLIFGDLGLIRFFKNTQGKPVERVAPLPNGNVRLIIEGNSYDVIDTIYKLLQRRPARNAMDDLIRVPLEDEGINGFHSSYDGHRETVTEDESRFFSLPDQVVSENSAEKWFTIVSLSFKENRKWVLDDGGSTISVAIGDQDFLRSVDKREESFLKDDRLHCIVRTTQTDTRNGLRTEHTVIKVLKHEHRAEQLPFPSDEST